MNKIIIGIDLGSQNDWTAVGVIQRYGEEVRPSPWKFQEYRLLHLVRYLGEPYTEIVAKIRTLLETPQLKDAEIVVDGTGVGRPVIDLMSDRGLTITPIIITGSENVNSEVVHGRREWRVPKRDLVGTLQVLLQNEQLKIPGTIDLKNELVTELQNFKVKILDSGHDTYEHWRSSDHDDLVLAVAMACWYAERKTPAHRARSAQF